MRPRDVKQADKDRHAGMPVTLDGRPATISGRLNDFATIACLDHPWNAVEFAWPTVFSIVAGGGAFKS